MKRIILISLSLVLLVSIFLSGCSKEKQEDIPDQENEQEEIKPLDVSIEEISILYIQALLDGKYEEAYTKYAHDTVMKGAVNPEQYKSMMDSLYASSGDFVEMKESFTYKNGIYNIVSIPLKLTKQNINVNVVFNQDKYISGMNFSEYQEASAEKLPDTIIEKELTANVNGYELGGTLTLPKEGENFPCVVLVHGSGPNNRDESIYQNKPFRDIAWGLAQKGIAVYRYDKRIYVYPEGAVDDYDFTLYDETIDDAVEIAKMIQSLDEINKDKVYILGHSLGGYAIPRIAENSKEAAGFVIMAGCVRSIDKLLPEQFEYIANIDGIISQEEQEQIDNLKAELEKLEKLDELPEDEIIIGAYKAYWQDMLSYDTIETATKIEKPVLVLQGERDYQVTMKEYNMWKEAFENDSNWSFITYPKLNHLMMPGVGKATPDEYQVLNRVEQKVIDDIAKWIK